MCGLKNEDKDWFLSQAHKESNYGAVFACDTVFPPQVFSLLPVNDSFTLFFFFEILVLLSPESFRFSKSKTEWQFNT